MWTDILVSVELSKKLSGIDEQKCNIKTIQTDDTCPKKKIYFCNYICVTVAGVLNSVCDE